MKNIARPIRGRIWRLERLVRFFFQEKKRTNFHVMAERPKIHRISEKIVEKSSTMISQYRTIIEIVFNKLRPTVLGLYLVTLSAD